MPKRYRIEMTLFDDKTNTQLEPTDKHFENYKDDDDGAEAKAKFAEKKKAARDAGKGRPA